MSNDDFNSKRAFHAMQAARQTMQESQEKMQNLQHKASDIYHEIGDLQAQHDKLKESKNLEWEDFSKRLAEMTKKVGEKIDAVNTCNEQEEQFRKMAKETDSEERRLVYEESARFFSKLASQKMLERDDLIAKKRQISSPDMSVLKEMREKLKNLRDEQQEILESYHEAKSDFSLKKTSFDRMKAKYESAKTPEQNQDASAFSSRPKAMELDPNLLELADVPKKDWDNCEMERRVDGKVDVFYGGEETVRHGHVVIDKNNRVEYARKPKKRPVIIVK